MEKRTSTKLWPADYERSLSQYIIGRAGVQQLFRCLGTIQADSLFWRRLGVRINIMTQKAKCIGALPIDALISPHAIKIDQVGWLSVDRNLSNCKKIILPYLKSELRLDFYEFYNPLTVVTYHMFLFE